MARFKFEFGFGALLLALFAAFWLWQNPGIIQGPLRPDEIQHYLAAVDRLPFPVDDKPQLIQRLRAWMEKDDGRPFYMLNLMRYYPTPHRFPGAPDFAGSSKDSNAHYEAAVMPMLFARGGYPAFAGNMHEPNLIEFQPALDDWSRLLLVRYPSRRAFMQLLSDPAYGPIEPYKMMALQVVLAPVEPEIVVGKATWLVAGGFAILFLAAGWWRAARRRSASAT